MHDLPRSLAATFALLSTALAGRPPALADGPAPTTAAPAVAASPCPAEAADLLAALESARVAAALSHLRLAAPLCRVARDFAADVAARGSAVTDESMVPRLTGAIYRAGYRPHTWELQIEIGARDAAEVIDGWRERDPEGFARVALGAVEDVGVGVAEAPHAAAGASTTAVAPAADAPPGAAATAARGRTWVLLLAVPEIRFEERLAAPLADRAAARDAVLAAANAERARAGVAPLRRDARLEDAAQRHAQDMLARGYYDHRSPEGTMVRQRLLATGENPQSVGENLAKGLFTPAEVVSRWMGSSGHRRNLLAPGFARVGVGIAVGEHRGHEEALWVLVFASER